MTKKYLDEEILNMIAINNHIYGNYNLLMYKEPKALEKLNNFLNKIDIEHEKKRELIDKFKIENNPLNLIFSKNLDGLVTIEETKGLILNLETEYAKFKDLIKKIIIIEPEFINAIHDKLLNQKLTDIDEEKLEIIKNIYNIGVYKNEIKRDKNEILSILKKDIQIEFKKEIHLIKAISFLIKNYDENKLQVFKEITDTLFKNVNFLKILEKYIKENPSEFDNEVKNYIETKKNNLTNKKQLICFLYTINISSLINLGGEKPKNVYAILNRIINFVKDKSIEDLNAVKINLENPYIENRGNMKDWSLTILVENFNEYNKIENFVNELDNIMPSIFVKNVKKQDDSLFDILSSIDDDLNKFYDFYMLKSDMNENKKKKAFKI